MEIPYFKLNEEGLNRFFGPLEASIMEAIWSATNQATIKEIQERIKHDHDISFNAVMTVMNRLVEKGHLLKIPHPTNKKITYFIPVVTKEEFLRKHTGTVTQHLFKDFGDHAVAHMIDALDGVDMEMLQKLEQKITELKHRREP
ncbi:BlaI/MecI/CopY family transcriptional regulator [Cohnella yongneupensis]|uniref:BlaI/MecI/CopY family transcriptional regulator n=1 Tax=Cohnella yongneupensis TaxID=425006 RepID=A0ABW0QWG8_9BACL